MRIETPPDKNQNPEMAGRLLSRDLNADANADAALDRLLKEGLGRSLDRQRGRAGEAFQNSLLNAERSMRNTEWRRLKLWTAGALALAACLVAAATLQFLGPAGGRKVAEVAPEHPAIRPEVQPQVHAPPAAPQLAQSLGVPVMNRVDYSRDVDGGTIVMDDVPLRIVRHQTLRRTEWVDPTDNATYSVTEPGEQVGYVRLQPN